MLDQTARDPTTRGKTHLFSLCPFYPTTYSVHSHFDPIIRTRPPRLVILPYIRPKDRLSPLGRLTVFPRRVRRAGPGSSTLITPIDDERLLVHRDSVRRDERRGAQAGRAECARAVLSVFDMRLGGRGLERKRTTGCCTTSIFVTLWILITEFCDA